MSILDQIKAARTEAIIEASGKDSQKAAFLRTELVDYLWEKDGGKFPADMLLHEATWAAGVAGVQAWVDGSPKGLDRQRTFTESAQLLCAALESKENIRNGRKMKAVLLGNPSDGYEINVTVKTYKPKKVN